MPNPFFCRVSLKKKQTIEESCGKKNVSVDVLMEADENTPGSPTTPRGFLVSVRKPCSGGSSRSTAEKSGKEK